MGSEQTISGGGSELGQTETVVAELPSLLRQYEIRSILDLPCGDFNWMNQVDLSGIDTYVGADVVDELVAKNTSMYGSGTAVRFEQLDLLCDSLPQADLILCRYCLVHFSFSDIKRALDNIAASRPTYLLTTTFVDRPSNDDIPAGMWRPLNLQAQPFSWPDPIATIVEGSTEGDGDFDDKNLNLWRLEDVASPHSEVAISLVPWPMMPSVAANQRVPTTENCLPGTKLQVTAHFLNDRTLPEY